MLALIRLAQWGGEYNLTKLGSPEPGLALEGGEAHREWAPGA